MFKLSCSIKVDDVIVPAGTPVAINTPNLIKADEELIEARYISQKPQVCLVSSGVSLNVPSPTEYVIRTDRKKPASLGLMLVGWGGNNGSTLTASLLANKLGLSWETRRGRDTANFLGSLVMASTVTVGTDSQGHEIHVPIHDIVPFADPDSIVLGGWDISKMSLGDALLRSRVLEPDLIRQVKPYMDEIVPLPSIYSPDFIASNQAGRVDNCIPGTKLNQLEQIIRDIREFKTSRNVDKVIVMWTANTERFCRVEAGVHDSWDNLMNGIRSGHPEISPSTIFAAASILSGCPFINGSPQNTCVPAIVDGAIRYGVPIGGDDFKSGQTKMKSVLVDFLISSGIKPLSIVSYNHLGNNDGRNLDEAAQFRSKEISKRGVVEDMVASNPIMYPPGKNEHPNHKVIIEYVPAVGDSKRAMDEYESAIFMGGRSTISMHNTCEDSLLAAPLMLDLVLLTEFFGRVQVGRIDKNGSCEGSMERLHPVMGLLSFCLKAPMFPPGTPIVNALMKQRRAIEELLRACVGLPPIEHLYLL